jgi:hypothetical protein
MQFKVLLLFDLTILLIGDFIGFRFTISFDWLIYWFQVHYLVRDSLFEIEELAQVRIFTQFPLFSLWKESVNMYLCLCCFNVTQLKVHKYFCNLSLHPIQLITCDRLANQNFEFQIIIILYLNCQISLAFITFFQCLSMLLLPYVKK